MTRCESYPPCFGTIYFPTAPRLYPRVRYDAAIIYGLEEKMTLEEMNSFLDEIGEEVLL